jgi:hypothetical protein
MLAASAIGIFFIPAIFYMISHSDTRKPAQIVQIAAQAGDD